MSPGPVHTPIIDTQVGTPQEAEAFRKQAAALVPLGRIGQPDELAAAALFSHQTKAVFPPEPISSSMAA
nr:hypothetical protein [Sodalis sp. dw_96]